MERLRQPHPSQEAERPYMPEATRRANNAKSTIRSRIEHVFAEQKERMGLFIRTVGIARATTKISLVTSSITSSAFFLRRAVVA
jgi:hypothetical protein